MNLGASRDAQKAMSLASTQLFVVFQQATFAEFQNYSESNLLLGATGRAFYFRFLFPAHNHRVSSMPTQVAFGDPLARLKYFL
jgi:hypothetical protein